MEPWVPGFVTGSLALLGVFVAGWYQSRRERHAADRTVRTPTPPTTQEVWQRMDRMERAFRSSLVLLGEVAEQWEGEHPPRLTKRHLMILAEEGYLPPEWEHIVKENAT